MVVKQLIIIDFDGTIVDSNRIWKDVYLEYCLIMKFQPSPKIEELFGQISFDEWLLTIKDIHNVPDNSIMKKIALKMYYKKEPQKGFADFIEENKKSEIIVVSRENADLINNYLNHNKIYSIQSIFQDRSNDRNGTIFYKEIAIKNRCHISDVLVIDDSLSHCVAAKMSGAYVIGINDHHTNERQEQMKMVCDMYVDDFTKILNA